MHHYSAKSSMTLLSRSPIPLPSAWTTAICDWPSLPPNLSSSIAKRCPSSRTDLNSDVIAFWASPGFFPVPTCSLLLAADCDIHSFTLLSSLLNALAGSPVAEHVRYNGQTSQRCPEWQCFFTQVQTAQRCKICRLGMNLLPRHIQPPPEDRGDFLSRSRLQLLTTVFAVSLVFTQQRCIPSANVNNIDILCSVN